MAKSYSEEHYGKIFGGKSKGDHGENRAYLDFAMEGVNLPEIDVSDPQQVLERCSLYFSRCSEEGLRPGIAAMCVWIGINRTRWQKWVSGEEFKTTHYALCNKINGIFDAQMEAYMQNGKINPVSGIFIMKNNYGYKDEQEHKVEAKDTSIQEMNMREILKLAAKK